MKKMLVAVALVFAATAAYANVQFVDLGTAAPPAAVGPIPVTAFALAPQQAIPNGATVTTIPGAPFGTLALNEAMTKVNIGAGWATWSHGYTGPVYNSFGGSSTTRTLTLPAGTTAFYMYVEPNAFPTFNVECVTNTGRSSGLIPVTGNAGANGFGFYATNQETLAWVRVTVDPAASGFAIGEFGLGNYGVSLLEAIPTLSTVGFAVLALLLCAAAFFMLRRRTA